MSQSQNTTKPFTSQSSQKSSTYKIEYNVDELLEESDDDDDDEDDGLFEDDEEMRKFKEKAGLLKSSENQKKVQYAQSTMKNTQEAIKLTANLGGAESIIQPQNIRGMNPTLSSHSGNKAKYQVSLSDSSDDSEEDIEAFIQKTKNITASSVIAAAQKKEQDKKQEVKQIQSAGGRNIKEIDTFLLQDNSVLKEQITDVLDMIEKNEKLNEVGAADTSLALNESASQLLSFDNKFYNVQKKLFDYNEYADIARKLHFQKNHQFSGMVSALTMVQDYLFIGNSAGIIRVFDLKTQKEMKPLMDESQLGSQNKVTCMEVSPDSAFLISGYKRGQVALWDLLNYKLIRCVSDVHQTEVLNAKIYHVDENDTLFALSAEESGRVQLLRFTKKSFLGGYSSEAQFLFKTRLRGTAGIAVQRKNELYPHKYCDSSSLVAFASLQEVVVCQMRPIKEIFQIPRPSSLCKEKSLPYVDWGYGLTPSQRDRTVPILAIGWDRLIQLIYINENTQTIEMDGFYYSDHEITSLFFMGDSILMALVNGREIKVLYTTKFYPGHYKVLETTKENGGSSSSSLTSPFEKVIQVTAHAELEKGFEVADVKSGLLQSWMVMNYHQSVKKYKNQVFFMCGKTIVRGKLFTWKEYLDHIKFKENYDWLTVLKVALEIYNGELKGYSKVPDEKEMREGILLSFMKDMIKESVNQVIFNFGKTQSNSSNSPDKSILASGQDNYQADAIAIKVSIEFCLAINATFFLFTEIYQLFCDNGLEERFLMNLEPFILNGSFKKVFIPENIIKKLIMRHETQQLNQQKFDSMRVLERLIQQMDLTEYSMKPELMVTCQVHCLISALLYLMSGEQGEELGCMQVLNTLLGLFRKAQNTHDIQKEDILLVTRVDSHRKYQVERSRAYIGYKLLWLMRTFLEGKSVFPSNSQLSTEKHRFHVYDIVNFLTTEQFLQELVSFDAEEVFKVLAKAFVGNPLKYLLTQKDYMVSHSVRGFAQCYAPDVLLNDLLYRKAQDGDAARIEYYNRMLVTVQAQNPMESGLIDHGKVVKAVEEVVSSKSEWIMHNEQSVIEAMRGAKFTKSEYESMLDRVTLMARALPKLRIFLHEKNKDYLAAFKLHLQSSPKATLFSWINSTLDKLSANGKTLEHFNTLKEGIKRSVRELVKMDVSESVALIDKWYQEEDQEHIILHELSQKPQIQYNYLRNFLSENQKKIDQAISEATYSNDRRGEAQRYLQYLILHVRLLCKLDTPLAVHDAVKQDFYPITECLQICREHKQSRAIAVLLKRNGQFLESISAYLGVLEDEIDFQEVVKELYQSAKSSKQQSHQWEFMGCIKLPQVMELDSLLQQAINIADKQEALIGEEGWFMILEFLGELKHRVLQKLQTQGVKDTIKLERVKEFFSQRKLHVLRLVPAGISLHSLTERLRLDFKQIKQLYDLKVKAVKNSEKYLKLANQIQEKELLETQSIVFRDSKLGLSQNDQSLLRCKVCDAPLSGIAGLQRQEVHAFRGCGHIYHAQCLKESKCPLGSKKSIDIAPKASAAEGRKSKVVGRHKSSKEEEGAAGGPQVPQYKNMAFMQGLAEQAFTSENQSHDKNIHADHSRNEALTKKRMEVFDQQLESAGLGKASFY